MRVGGRDRRRDIRRGISRAGLLQRVEFLHFLQIGEDLEGFVFIHATESEAGVNDDVIADGGLGHEGEADLLEEAAEIDVAHAGEGVAAADALNFSGDGQAHGLCFLAGGRDDLAEGEAAVVGRDALMPIGAEARGPQEANGAFGQVTILETTAAQGDGGLADAAGHLDNGLGQGVVKFGGDDADPDAVVNIGHNGVNHRGPIQNEGRLKRKEWHLVEFIGVDAIEGELEFHGGLAFEMGLLAKAGEGGNGVEEAAGAGGHGGMETAVEHGPERGQFGF